MFNAELKDFPNVDVRLTKTDFVDSLSDELLGVSFRNSDGETVYPCGVKQRGSNQLLVEMEDGTGFVLRAEEVKCSETE